MKIFSSETTDSISIESYSLAAKAVESQKWIHSMFTGLTSDLCDQAWRMVEPAVVRSFDHGVINKYGGTVIVLDPGVRPRHGSTINDLPILFNVQLVTSRGAERYTEFARAKAFVSWMTGLSNREVQQHSPYLYQLDMVKWGGSFVLPGGLVVAFSGVQAVISAWMAFAIQALCRDAMTKPDGVMASKSAWIGGDPEAED